MVAVPKDQFASFFTKALKDIYESDTEEKRLKREHYAKEIQKNTEPETWTVDLNKES